MLGAAGDVPVDVPVKLKSPSDACRDERLQGAEDGRAADALVAPMQPPVQVLRRDLPTDRDQCIRDRQALAGDTLAGSAQPLGGRRTGQCPPTAAANIEKP